VTVRPLRADVPVAPIDRSRLPAAGPTAQVRFPAIGKTVLPNGLRVWTVRHASIPVVTITVLVSRGAADDPPGKEGLAALTADMLDEGSGKRSAIEMHEALARIGAQLDSDIGPDSIVLSLSALSRFTEPALALVADMTARPTLSEADFERVRQLRLHRLTQLRDMPGVVADRTFARLLYGAHPYGHTPLGSEPALVSMDIDDVRAFHAGLVRPSAATLIVVGDCDHEHLVRVAGACFGGWEGQAAATPPPSGDLPRPPRLNVVPRPGAPQSELRIGHVAAPRDTPDYHALVTANMVLGGQFVSRINLNLREDKGFTYGARTSFDFRRLPGPFALQVSVETASTAAAIRESLDEIAGIRGSRPVTPDELALGVAALTRGYARNFETAEQVARAVMQIALYDLPDTWFDEFVSKIERVSLEETTAAAARHLHPDCLTTLVVGDFEAIARDLDGLGLGEPVALAAGSF
jgi:predicted Zn-dependent peptidase